MRTSRKLSVALACPGGSWPHPDWPAPDDRYVERAVRLRPSSPFHVPEGVDAVVLYSTNPVDDLGSLRAGGVPVIVVAPYQDPETIAEVFRRGAGYLVEGDYCTCMLSSALVGAPAGHTYLSPAACAALREREWQAAAPDVATERLRGRLAPRERQIMELLSTGLGAQEIGLRLGLSEKTVRNNLSNIYAKLDARGSTDAVLRWLGAAPVLRV
ncbi:response regulator transcription factor [Streptomyces sp. NRRL B-1140]|uniref:response regulator transcription factor n=1 Tax=Streptomyces sp. NRRL B-1140 TaxID=1415549 RepID=UPI0006AF4E74|nr:response regulator transcription factor [Streptomyces sp. NRRL B-1140]